MLYVQQSSTPIVFVGPFFDRSTGAAVTSLTSETLSYTGSAVGVVTASLTHIAGGMYYLTLPTTISGSVGAVTLTFASNAAYRPVTQNLAVITQDAWTLLFVNGGLTSGTVTVISPVSDDGDVDIVAGTAYTSSTTPLTLTITGYTGPSVAGGSCKLDLEQMSRYVRTGISKSLEQTGTISVNGQTITLTIGDISAARTAALSTTPPDDSPNYKAHWRLYDSGGNVQADVFGDCTVRKPVQ